MRYRRQCCCCRLVAEPGDRNAPTTHYYCRICAAAQLRQLAIWDAWAEDAAEEKD